LIWSGLTVLSWPVFLFAIAVLLIRPIAFFISLAGTPLDFRSRLLIAWFGPRGLSSLLLILVPVFAAVPGTEPLFSICCFIVLLSVVLHGGSLMFLERDEPTAESLETAPATAEGTVARNSSLTSFGDRTSNHNELISIAEMRDIQKSGAPNLALDVRAERNLADSDLRAGGSVRIPPDLAVKRIMELDVPRQTWLFAFCA
jgi:sodium/hydrogen antiporter